MHGVLICANTKRLWLEKSTPRIQLADRSGLLVASTFRKAEYSCQSGDQFVTTLLGPRANVSFVNDLQASVELSPSLIALREIRLEQLTID